MMVVSNGDNTGPNDVAGLELALSASSTRKRAVGLTLLHRRLVDGTIF